MEDINIRRGGLATPTRTIALLLTGSNADVFLLSSTRMSIRVAQRNKFTRNRTASYEFYLHLFSVLAALDNRAGSGIHADACVSFVLSALDGESLAALGWVGQVVPSLCAKGFENAPLCRGAFSFYHRSLFFRLVNNLGCQPLEGKRGSGHHVSQGVQKQVGILPAVESEGHFLAIGLEMLGTHAMPRANNPALEQRECRFNAVGVNVAFRIDAELVADRLVPSILAEMLRGALICLKIISKKNLDILTDILADVLLKSPALHVFRVKEAKIAAALPDTYDYFLVIVSGRFPLITINSADVGFIHLNLAIQHWLLALDHCGTDSVTKIPSSLVTTQTERTLNLTCAHTLLSFAEKQRSHEPFSQRQVGIVKDGSRGHGELIVAILAVVQSFFSLKLDRWHLAARTLDTFRPAQAGKHLAASLVGREHGVYIN
jgi:hypothetical protein